ncbi:MAG: terpene cyclase/mutase family protein [Ruminococcus sp.]|nr:terpene cyclase/mutase family protein [Ruminococcus sp.]
MKNVRKALSVLLAAVLAGNAGAAVRISTSGSDGKDLDEMYSSIVNGALSYLDGSVNSDGSVGDSSTVNDTADALYTFRIAGERDLSPQLSWLGAFTSTGNTDISARLTAATGVASYLDETVSRQAPDGGFGVDSDYSSDVLDTLLVLGAVSDCGGGSLMTVGEKAAQYLLDQAGADGGYSYTEASGTDGTLTALALYDLSRFVKLAPGNAETVSQGIAPTAELVRSSEADWSDSGIDETVTAQLALLSYDGKIDSAGVIESLYNAQKSDGSFAGSVHTTSYAIRLLRDINAGRYVKLTQFSTDLSTDTGAVGESTPISAVTNIGYEANYAAAYTLKMTAKNGESVIYENSTAVNIGEGSGELQINAGSFRLNEPSDEGVTVTIGLYDGEELIRSEIISLTLTPRTIEESTELGGFTLSLDNYLTLAGIPTDVTATGRVLYATNVDKTARIEAALTKDGQVLEENSGEVVLSAEDNSVSTDIFKISFDTDEAGEYIFSAKCLYEGKELFSDQQTFTVIERPVPVTTAPVTTVPEETVTTAADQPEQTTAPEVTTVAETTTVPVTTEPYFNVLWMQPVLSEMVVYAGQKNDITGQIGIVYDSNAPFTGELSIKAVSGEETIAENTVPVELEPVDMQNYDYMGAMPKYETESLIAFTVDTVGTTDVTAVLTDSEGNEIWSATRKVEVISKPVQDLILYAETDEDGNAVDLRWNDISSEHEIYDYQLNRRIKGGKWEPRSIWNEEESIRVLNVYPYQPYLETWMTTTIGESELPAGMGIFDIDSVHIATYNADPTSYMKNSDGSWKYDVLYFGSSDCNSHYDISDSACEILHQFVDEGRGVLFGHDTVCVNFGHMNFASFADELGIIVKYDSTVNATNSVSVVKIGTMTNYPWNIRGTLNVPACHSYGQYVGGTLEGTEWMTLNTTQLIDQETGAHSNFYLVTNNNLGMIQTGHSTGSATDDERKVLANTLFYLYQISRLTNARDTSFYDIDAPDVPDASVSPVESGAYEVKAGSKDNGTEYEYSIVANPSTGNDKAYSSNMITKTIISGLDGFVIEMNDSPLSSPELLVYDENNEFITNLIPADENGTATAQIVPESFDAGQYIHIFAVDKAGNVSDETILPADDLSAQASISTDKRIYLAGESASLMSDSWSAPFGQTADGVIEIRDEFDNPTQVISSMDSTKLTASEHVSTSDQWQIPEDLYGRYKAVIRWTRDGEVIAEDEAPFKISGEESVSNLITSDKKIYSTADPVNLTSAVFNKSTNIVENDLTLNITVRSADTGAQAAVFTRQISSLNPKGDTDFSDAIAAGSLPAGRYLADAEVTQDGIALTEDSAEFTVEETIAAFTGNLSFTPSGTTANAEFTAEDTGSANAPGAKLIVDVFTEAGEKLCTIEKTADIASGGSVSFSEALPAGELAPGRYSGALRIEYGGESSDLAYAGFDIAPPVTAAAVPATAPQSSGSDEAEATQTTAAATTTAPTTTAKPDTKVSSPKTGPEAVPWYIWTMSALSLMGLIALKKTGGKEENED